MQFTKDGDDITIRKVPRKDLIEVLVRGKKHLYERCGQKLTLVTEDIVQHESFIIEKIRQYFVPSEGRKTYWVPKDRSIRTEDYFF